MLRSQEKLRVRRIGGNHIEFLLLDPRRGRIMVTSRGLLRMLPVLIDLKDGGGERKLVVMMMNIRVLLVCSGNIEKFWVVYIELAV